MLAIYIGSYVFFLSIVWVFFFVARHHAYKFEHMSTNIALVTRFLFIFLLILSVGGFILLFSFPSDTSSVSVDVNESTQVPQTENFY